MKVVRCFLGVVVLALFTLTETSAQWVKVTSPYNPPFPSFGNVSTLASYGTNLFAGTNGGGVYLSTDAGTTWTLKSNGLGNYTIYDLAFLGTNLYAATSGQLFRSTDFGANWTALTSGLTAVNPLSSVFVNNSALFCSSYGDGAFMSADYGANWTAINSGLPVGKWVSSFAAIGVYLFAGTDAGVFRSTNNGTTWSAVNTGLTYPLVYRLATDGSNLLAGTDKGTFLSSDNGAQWYFTGLKDTIINDFAVGSEGTFAATTSGVFVSRDHGISWKSAGTGVLVTDGIMTVALYPGNGGPGTYVYASTGFDGLWRRPLNEMVTSVGEAQAEQPGNFALMQNYPNPFNPVTQINYTIGDYPEGAPFRGGTVGGGDYGRNVLVQLSVYDILGRQVAVLVNERQSAGPHQVTFNAAELPTGVYFYRLQTGGVTLAKRMMLVK